MDLYKFDALVVKGNATIEGTINGYDLGLTFVTIGIVLIILLAFTYWQFLKVRELEKQFQEKVKK